MLAIDGYCCYLPWVETNRGSRLNRRQPLTPPANKRGKQEGSLDSDPLATIARRVCWWEPAEVTLANTSLFLARVMVFGTWDDVCFAIDRFGKEAFREALNSAPPGLFDNPSWHYWHHLLHILPVPPLPQRMIPACASLLDLAAQKMKVILVRAEAKDYQDIYTLAKAGVTLPQALGAAKALYPEFNPVLSLKALTYYGEPSLAALPVEIREFLTNEAAKAEAIKTVPKVASVIGISTA